MWARPVTPGGGAAGGPPGTWVLKEKGSTSVDNAALIALSTFTVEDGEVIFVPSPTIRDDTIGITYQDATGSVGVDDIKFHVFKTAVADQHQLRIRHNTGAAITVDWAVYTVVPP
jgi:hypothetical protein